MADTNLISSIGSGVAEKIFGGILWFGIALILIITMGFIMWYFLLYKKKFDIKVKLISERANGEIVEIMDKAAILKDFKEKIPFLKIWGLKRDFPIPKYDVMRKLYDGRGIVDYLEIYRKGENEFYFLLPPTIDKRMIVKSDGQTQLIAEQTQLMMDPEMAFWATKRKTLNKKLLNTESLLFKLLPYIGIILGGAILIFILYILLDHLPAILSSLTKLVEEMGKYQRAEIVTSTTTILPLLLWKK